MLKNKFIFLGILTEIIYLLFYFIEPLRKYFGDTALTLHFFYLFLLVVFLLIILLIIYIVAFKEISKKNINFKTIFIFFIFFNLTLLFVWPIGSIDIFSYIGWSRVLSEHHVNPYLTAYSAFPNDAFYQQINNKWLSLPTPYGPLFTVIGSSLAWIGGNSLLLSLFLFKLFFIIINILNCLLVHKTFKSNKATFLYAWNPFILYEFSVNGHSDILTIFFLLLGLYFLLHKQQKFINYILCWIFLMLSVLIKYTTAVLLPVVFLIILFKLKSRKEKILFLLFSCTVSVVILSIFYWPFLKAGNIFGVLILYMSHPNLIWFPPIVTTVLMFLFYHFKVTNYYDWSFIVGKIIFLIFYIFLLVWLFVKHTLLKNKDIIKYSCLSLFVFLFVFPSWILSWYYTPLLVLLIYYSAVNNFKYNKFIYGITLLGILYYIIQR